tara:strand:+ start:3429 stop:3575 length:147 start_codon:yes stop_codon:yes gene_type:complete
MLERSFEFLQYPESNEVFDSACDLLRTMNPHLLDQFEMVFNEIDSRWK